MKKIILPLLLCLCGLSLPATLQAQDSLSVKPQATAPYKVAVGARFSAGGPTGADLSITAKYFIGKQSALEAQSTVNPQNRYFLASLSYIWQPQLLTSSRFRPYAGLGVGVLRSRNYYYDGRSTSEHIKVNPVGVATIGVEYTFPKAPIALSLDYRSTFLRLDNTSTQPTFDLRNSSNIGLGVKFLIR
ncbi:porin family protein [Pontibacter ruber]|uniref:Porin family protein n=1 Tax=Pontibacter ruber TaxID=1343895 RepID=A0ABW5CX88_9BACT|nr:porin family protein [Pontibacter ruber]